MNNNLITWPVDIFLSDVTSTGVSSIQVRKEIRGGYYLIGISYF